MTVKQIDVLEAKQLLKNKNAIFLDIRDDVSYALGHPEQAIHLSSGDLSDFVTSTDKAMPIMILCYHGVSSISLGEYLLQEGFEEVYSISGGYEEWKRVSINE